FYWFTLPMIFLVGTWQSWQWWSWLISSPLTPQQEGETVQIEIPQGMGIEAIGQELQDAGLIRSTTTWRVWFTVLKLKNSKGNMQAGTYDVPVNATLPAIASKIWEGQVEQVSFTIPEGWTIRQMAKRLSALGYFEEEEFLAAAQTIPYDRYPWLPKGIDRLEGFLFPDTYALTSDKFTPEEVINAMLTNFEDKALPLYQQSKNRLDLKLLDWLTLASVVEKEAMVTEERPIIAGVFVNRLESGMMLQSDPTVEYALGIKQTKQQPLTLNQVQTQSPYNTYMNTGLPPTPIASPGEASLLAVNEPADTPYNYFVARYDGTHVFSETLEQHEAAVITIREEVEATADQAGSSAAPESNESAPDSSSSSSANDNNGDN
ncbi:MAG: endolytic transglycosylase MltG, partial [Synechococcaceae cyanobacterium RL_1_2]|nr:endolytic transglycosylase MltG [Synechococcaceae cyanobacterium RL_1_2]